MVAYLARYGICFLGLIFCTAGIIISMRRTPSREQNLLFLIEIAGFMILLGHWGALQSMTASADLLVFATKLQYIGAFFIYGILMTVIVYYFRVRIPKPLYVGQLALAIALAFVILTLDKHRLFYKSYHVENINGINTLVKEYAFLHTVYFVYVAVYAVVFGVVTVWTYRKSKLNDRVHAETNVVLLIAIIPSVGYLLARFGPLKELRVVPVTITIVSAICLYFLLVRKYMDVRSIAQGMVIDSIKDISVIIIDTKRRLIQCNNEAEKLFPFLSKIRPQEKLDVKAPEFWSIFKPVIDGGVYGDYVAGKKVYTPIAKPVVGADGRLRGYILILYDVTIERDSQRLLNNWNAELQTQVNLLTLRNADIRDEMISGFATLAEGHNLVTGRHVKRTSSYVRIIATEMKREGMHPEIINDEWIRTLRKVASLHDIGKITISDTILNKPGPLTADEFAVMKTHTTAGAEIIKTLMRNLDKAYIDMAVDVAHYHHERWDGKGYPEGIAGGAIPLSARIMAVADVFDAIVSRRPYKEPFSLDEAFGEIEKDAGSHFDADVAKAFLNARDEIVKVYEELKD